MCAGGGKNAGHAGARVRRAADHLHGVAMSRVDQANTQTVGIRMLFCFDDLCDRKRAQEFERIVHMLKLQPDHGERVCDLAKRGVGLKVLLQPGEREFHGFSVP